MENIILQKFGNSVAFIRKQMGLTQEELAFKSDLSTNYVRKIEKGLVNPSLKTIRKIAKALDINIGELIELIG